MTNTKSNTMGHRADISLTEDQAKLCLAHSCLEQYQRFPRHEEDLHHDPDQREYLLHTGAKVKIDLGRNYHLCGYSYDGSDLKEYVELINARSYFHITVMDKVTQNTLKNIGFFIDWFSCIDAVKKECPSGNPFIVFKNLLDDATGKIVSMGNTD